MSEVPLYRVPLSGRGSDSSSQWVRRFLATSILRSVYLRILASRLGDMWPWVGAP